MEHTVVGLAVVMDVAAVGGICGCWPLAAWGDARVVRCPSEMTAT